DRHAVRDRGPGFCGARRTPSGSLDQRVQLCRVRVHRPRRHARGDVARLDVRPTLGPRPRPHGDRRARSSRPAGGRRPGGPASAACLEACDGLDVWLSVLPPLSEMFIRPSLVTQVAGIPLIPLGKVNRTRGTLPGKRAFDLAGATAALVVLSPLLLVTVIAMK